MSRRACICILTVRMTGHDGIWLPSERGILGEMICLEMLFVSRNVKKKKKGF